MTWLHSTRGLLSNSSKVTHATGDEDRFPAIHEAMARVLPMPGGPMSAVSGPCTPPAMSWSSLGRGTAQSGTTGIVILDLRIDTSASIDVRARPINPAAARAAIGTPLSQHAKRLAPRTRQVLAAARGHA
jgi:hypothetical protein